MGLYSFISIFDGLKHGGGGGGVVPENHTVNVKKYKGGGLIFGRGPYIRGKGLYSD